LERVASQTLPLNFLRFKAVHIPGTAGIRVWLLVRPPWERGHPARRGRCVRAGYNGVRMALPADGIRGGRMAKRGAGGVHW